MAGWGSDSFDVGVAGGWGDTSYSATEAPSSDALRNLEKVAVPVVISDLSRNVNPNDEKLTFGKASFSTIRIVGEVKSAIEQDGGQSVEYKIGSDFESPDEFLVIHYRGVNPNDMDSDLFVEGTTVSVVGKLRNFDNRLAIVAFDVREVEDKREIEAFRLEAELAKLYYTKDVLEQIKANPSHFENTILRGNLETAQPQTNGTAAASTWGQSTDTGTQSNRVENVKGLVGQRAAIYMYLSKVDSVEGASLDEIKKNMPKNLFNPRTFAGDFESLLSEGHVYSTIDDDHFTAN